MTPIQKTRELDKGVHLSFFPDLSAQEKVEFADWLLNLIEELESKAVKTALTALLEAMPDGDKMPAILMGGRDYGYQNYATSAYKYAIDQVTAIIEGMKVKSTLLPLSPLGSPTTL